jgi:hypothetical protein
VSSTQKTLATHKGTHRNHNVAIVSNYVSNVAIECFTLLLIKHDAMLMIRD